MLEDLITNKTRIKLLVKFFINPNTKSYLRELESEFNVSSNAIRIELNKFVQANVLDFQEESNKKMYYANKNHSLFNEIHSIVLKHIGLDKVIDNIVCQAGNISESYLIGSISEGKNGNIIDVVLIGDDLDERYIAELVKRAEGLVNKKIRTLIITEKQKNIYCNKNALLIWKNKHEQRR